MKKLPAALRPYRFHGVRLHYGVGDTDTSADCVFCGREGKLQINTETGVYHCFACDAKGNLQTFLEWLWKESDSKTTNYSELEEWGLLQAETSAMRWGLCRSILTGEWLAPGYSTNGKLVQVYRWAKLGNNQRLLATPTRPNGMFGRIPQEAKTVYVAEGLRDAMVFDETMRQAKQGREGKLVATANTSASLLAQIRACVVGCAGCNALEESWVRVLAGRTVVLLFDNDYPRKHPKTGSLQPPAALLGLQRAWEILGAKANGVLCLAWGPKGFDSSLPSGTDLRDVLTAYPRITGRVAGLASILNRIDEVPAVLEAAGLGAVRAQAKAASSNGRIEPCETYRELVNCWRKALRWTNGLDHALASMLATVVSTPANGDQLWMKIIGPPACGKSTLCEAISTADELVCAKSTIRGFHSGFRANDGGSTDDHSLIPQIQGKTLVTKDGDTLLQSPNLSQILAEGRDLYDGVTRTHYRNAMSRDYEDLRVTWLLCGTSSLRAIDTSELGERFLDCVIMEGIDDELEDEVLWRKVNQVDKALSTPNSENTSQYEPALELAMKKTGGYLYTLSDTARETLPTIAFPVPQRQLVTRLAKYTAFMRARPSRYQEENAERELATRLVSQLTRLAKHLALVFNKQEVDAEVMGRVKRVALDTSRGQTLDITKLLHGAGKTGLEAKTLSLHLGKSDYQIRVLLRFLQQIGCVQAFRRKEGKVVSRVVRWRLTERMARLFVEVHGDA